jgi:hypothetical protein
MKPQMAIDLKNTNDKLLSPFVVLMISLDHSLVHVLNKFLKLSNV